MVATEPWFIGDRAIALATMYLTRRQDLEILPVVARGHDSSDDIRVELRSQSNAFPVHFLVKVKGVLRSGPRPGRSNGVFPVRYTRQELEYQGIPVCVFLFTVDDEQGYYRWLYEPVIAEQKNGVLQLDQSLESVSSKDRESLQVVILNKFERLDNDAIDKMVHDVAEWYKVARSPMHPAHLAL